jgi:glycosyltransferase involved in cell wall biosynthesis
MLARAVAERADLYIAHNPQALPVACRAAELVNAKVAFDSEDYHIGEFDQSEENTLAYRLTANLESKYLHRCEYVTSPSDGICDAIMHRYKVKRVLTLRNVFPLAERGTLNNNNEDRRGKALSLYWYSQVVGLNRGVQDAIKAALLLSEPVQIHIRGEATEEIKRELSSLLNGNETKVSLFFHPQVQPMELLSRTAEHDIGLALELDDSENRRLTVTNKFYFYALAGLAIGATNTKGQESEMERHPEIGFTYKSGAHTDLAKHLQRYIDDPDLLKRTKNASLAAAEKEWNWERESQRLISLVESVF